MSASACPAGAIIVCHYYVFCKYGKQDVKIRSWVGVVAFLGGLMLALMGGGQIFEVWANIPAFVSGFVGSFVIYYICGKADLAMTKAQPVPKVIEEVA